MNIIERTIIAEVELTHASKWVKLYEYAGAHTCFEAAPQTATFQYIVRREAASQVWRYLALVVEAEQTVDVFVNRIGAHTKTSVDEERKPALFTTGYDASSVAQAVLNGLGYTDDNGESQIAEVTLVQGAAELLVCGTYSNGGIMARVVQPNGHEFPRR